MFMLRFLFVVVVIVLGAPSPHLLTPPNPLAKGTRILCEPSSPRPFTLSLILATSSHRGLPFQYSLNGVGKKNLTTNQPPQSMEPAKPQFESYLCVTPPRVCEENPQIDNHCQAPSRSSYEAEQSPSWFPKPKALGILVK